MSARLNFPPGPDTSTGGVQRRARTTVVGIALYAMLCLIWGSTWLVIKVGYGGLGPFNVAAIRFFVAGLLMAAVVPMTRARWPHGRTEWRLVVLVGMLMFAADYGLIYWSEQYIDSGLTAVLFATLPLITICVAHLYLPGERITGNMLAGTLFALAGVAALFGDHLQIDSGKLAPMLGVIFAAVCAAVAAVASKRDGAALHPAALNAPSMLIGAVVLAVLSVVRDGFVLPRDSATWGAISYLALVGSVLAFLVYFWLLKTWTVTSLSFITVFTPVVALLLGFIFLDERPTIWTLAGAVLICSGVGLALLPRSVDQHDI